MIALLATAALTVPAAKQAIVTVERTYNPGSVVWADSCHRRTRRQVACIAHATLQTATLTRHYRVRDVVTLQQGGILRVHQAEGATTDETRVLQ